MASQTVARHGASGGRRTVWARNAEGNAAAVTPSPPPGLSKPLIPLDVEETDSPHSSDSAWMTPPPGLVSQSSPPGLSTSPQAFMAVSSTGILFADSLRQRQLPGLLAADDMRRERFSLAILSCVEGLYRDRIAPTLGEVQMRLRRDRAAGWLDCEVRAAVLPICAREAEKYVLSPPFDGEPPRVLLKSPPAWFEGWVDIEATDTDGSYCDEVEKALREVLLSSGNAESPLCLSGGVSGAALQLRGFPKLPLVLRRLSLGQIEHVLELALGRGGLLKYDPFNGRRLLLREGGQKRSPRSPRSAKAGEDAEDTDAELMQLMQLPASPATPASPASAVAPVEALKAPVVDALAEALANRELPEAVSNLGAAHILKLQVMLLSCVECLYKNNVEPTLREVQQRLRKEHDWSFEELQSVPLLAARDPARYNLVAPALNQPFKVLLKQPPQSAQSSTFGHLAGNQEAPDEGGVAAATWAQAPGGVVPQLEVMQIAQAQFAAQAAQAAQAYAWTLAAQAQAAQVQAASSVWNQYFAAQPQQSMPYSDFDATQYQQQQECTDTDDSRRYYACI